MTELPIHRALPGALRFGAALPPCAPLPAALAAAALASLALRGAAGAGLLGALLFVPALRRTRGVRGAAAATALFGLAVGLPAAEAVAPLSLRGFSLALALHALLCASVGGAFGLLRRRAPEAAPALLPLLWCALETSFSAPFLEGFASPVSSGYLAVGTPLVVLARSSGVTAAGAGVWSVAVAVDALRRRRVRTAALPLATLAVLAVLACFGAPRGERAPALAVAVVHPAFGDLDRVAAGFDPAARRAFTERLGALSAAALRFGPDLLLWPEGSVPVEVGPAGPDASVRAALSPVPTLFAAPRRRGAARTNSAFLAREGSVAAVYDKQHLVPFSEAWAQPGDAPGRVEIGGVAVGVGICFDSVLPRGPRATVRSGAEVLVSLTNTSRAADRLHLLAERFRAIETARPLLRADAGGSGAVIDARGRVLARARPGAPSVLIARVRPGAGRTAFVRWGDRLGPLAVLASAAALLRAAVP